MRKPIVIFSAMLIAAVLATCLAFTSLRADSLGESSAAVAPPGDWSLVCLPTLRPQPLVDVYSVTTNALKGLTITQVGVTNRSSKNAIGVKLGWRLFLEGDPQTSLKQGITPLLGVPLSPGERRVVEFPVVKAASVLAAISNDGSLRGQFRIEVAIVDVLFEENAKRPTSREHASLFKAVSWGNPVVLAVEVESYVDPTRMEGACQDQVCKWEVAGCYKCSEGAGFGCSPSGCNSCTETRCPGLE